MFKSHAPRKTLDKGLNRLFVYNGYPLKQIRSPEFMQIRNIAIKVKIAVFILGGLLSIYALLGFYLLPVLIKSKLPSFIRQETGRTASLTTVKFNPFTLQLNLHGFEFQEPNNQLFAGFDDFFIDFNALQSINRKALAIDTIVLNKPFVRIAKNKDGVLNVNSLINAKPEACAEPCQQRTFPLAIGRLSIIEGKAVWEDARLASPETETFYPINLSIENLTTQTDRQSNIDLSLALSSSGKLDWHGALSLNPLSATGHIRLNNVLLSRIRALIVQDLLPLKLLGYELFEADFNADFIDNAFNVTISRGKFELCDTRILTEDQSNTLINIPKLSASGIGFNLNRYELTIESVLATDADFKGWLDSQGVFNYQTLLPTSASPTSPTPAQQTPWTIKIDDIALKNFGVRFEDQSLKKPATLIVKPIDFKLKDFNNKTDTSLPFQLNAKLNDTGLIKFDGNTVIDPLSLQIAIDIQNIALEKFQTYVDKFARLDVIDGILTVGGNISISQSTADRLAIKFTGNSKIADFLTRDQKKNKDLVKWENLTLNGIDIDFPANQYSAESLVINKPYLRVVIRPDKSINFGDIIISETDKAQQDRSTDSATLKPNFKLSKLQIINGSSDFSDLSLILPFAAKIKSLDGGASGISTEQHSKIKIDLKGNAYNLAPVDITGEISPYLGDYHAQLNFSGMPMPLISSYMVQFAGYKIENGKMSLELDYQIADKKLSATNTILIDRFELGEKVENPNAVSLPLELAVALMKDTDGKIKLHVPISGSLQDPSFNLKEIVFDAFVNSIYKVVHSPFQALASIIGSEQDLSSIGFAAGDAILTQQQTGKLDDLALALKKRPDLKLEIKGAAFQEQDWPAVSDDALYDQLKRIKAADINKQGGRKIRPEYVIISDQDYRILMEQLFAEKFPQLVERSMLGTLRLVNTKADTSTHEFYRVAKEKLSAIIQPEEQRLKNLAEERAQAIADYIVQKGGIASERVFILDTVIDPSKENVEIISSLSLRTD